MDMRAVFDTNILIDYLKGIDKAQEELEKFESRIISIMTYIEVLVGVTSSPFQQEIQSFLESFEISHVTLPIAELTIKNRQHHKLKIPDAIILSTAQHYQALLVTRNTKDFNSSLPIVRIPYTL
jgi:predicted nucleic acid-binding protein